LSSAELVAVDDAGEGTEARLTVDVGYTLAADVGARGALAQTLDQRAIVHSVEHLQPDEAFDEREGAVRGFAGQLPATLHDFCVPESAGDARGD
jgi:hypothetical protein